MGIESINEPGQGHTWMVQPVSINEPPKPEAPPLLTSLNPSSCVIGDPDFTLVIAGDALSADSMIIFAGHEEPTTFNEADGSVSTGVNMAVWQGPDTVKVSVRNGLAFSNELDFTFNAAGTRAESHTLHVADPDDIEDEIEQEIEEGDIKPLHPPRKKRR